MSELERLLADSSVITGALRRAAMEVLRSHQRTGDPVVVWRDGRVVELSTGEIDALLRELTTQDSAA